MRLYVNTAVKSCRMEPLIELQAEKTVVVLGPLFAGSLLEEGARQPPLEYHSLKAQLLQAVRQVNGAKKLKEISGTLVQDAMKLLQNCGLLEQWLSVTFTGQNTVGTPQLEVLLEMQRRGALLVSPHLDSVCEQASGLPSLTLSQITEWSRGACGILHPFGVHTDKDSLSRFMDHGLTTLSRMPEALSAVLRERTFVFLGFNTEDDYFRSLVDIASTHCPQKPLHILPRACCTTTSFPSLIVPVKDIHAADVLSLVGEPAKQLGCLVEFPPFCEDEDSIAFVLSNKSSSRSVLRTLSSLPGAGFALMSSFQYGDSGTLYSLALQVSSNAVFRFWNCLLAENVAEELVRASVLAVVLPNGTCIWLNGARKLSGMEVDTKPSIAALVNGETTARLNYKRERNSPSPLSVNRTHSRTIPRFTVTKHKSPTPHAAATAAKKPFTDTTSGGVSSSILKRRLSLPPHLVVPPANTGKVAPNAGGTVNQRHQILLGRYIFKRKPCSQDAKLIKDLLKEEIKEKKTRAKINIYSTKVDSHIFERRRNLFAGVNKEWSTDIQSLLERKMARWHQLKQKRLQAKLEKEREEEKERVRKSSLDSTSSDGTVKQLLTPSYASGAIPVQTVSGLHPYLIPQANGLPVMYSTTPYLQAYPFVTTLPVNRASFPYISQFPSSNLVFVPSGASLPTTTCSTAATLLRPQNGSVSSPPAAFSLAHTTSPMSPAMTTTTTTINGGKAGQKRSREQSQQQFSFTNISSLLKSDLPTLQQARTMSPVEERSDGEDSSSDRCSPRSPESGQLKLWQFVLELLLSQSHSHVIEWNFGASMEFKIKQPRLLAELWSGIQKTVTDPPKLKRALYYYSTRSPPILSPVEGKEWSFKFTNSVSWYIHSRNFQLQKEVGLRKMTSDISGSREVLVVD